MPGGRPTRTLVERLADRSFRPERYGDLLEQELPDNPPELPPLEKSCRWAVPDDFYGSDDELRHLTWQKIRELQKWWRLSARDRSAAERYAAGECSEIAREVAALMHYLHGGRKPAWYEEVSPRYGGEPSAARRTRDAGGELCQLARC